VIQIVLYIEDIDVLCDADIDGPYKQISRTVKMGKEAAYFTRATVL
jgi:hypothetical protein